MCGRVRIRATKRELEEAFDVEVEAEFPARYNLAPTEAMPVIVPEPHRRVLTTMRWGFASDRALLINARSESVASRPAFSESFLHRRCLVPVDAFYEWKRSGKSSQPFLVEMADKHPFAIAAIWEPSPEGDRCCLLTTESNELVGFIHDRMPVIVAREHYDAWLDPGTDAFVLRSLLKPFPPNLMNMYPVKPVVNKAGYDAPDCSEPLDQETIAPPDPSQRNLF